MDRIKVKITDFVLLHDYINLWGNYKKSKFPNRHIWSREIVNDKANVKRRFRLTLMLYYDDVKEKLSISFNGSIRKWYFGENTRKDLNHSEFLNCIKLLSAKIGIREVDLWNARVTQLESGVTLLLKSDFKEINRCFIKYRSLERREDRNTLYFDGKKSPDCEKSKYGIKLYEKYLEINKNDERFEENPRKLNVHKKFLFFRMEIIVDKVSANAFYKKKANTLNKIRLNWNVINEKQIKYFESMHFVDMISKNKFINVETLGIRNSKRYIQFQKINRNGFFEELEKFELENRGTNSTKKLKVYLKNYEYFLEQKINYRSIVLSELKKKMERLYSKSNI